MFLIIISLILFGLSVVIHLIFCRKFHQLKSTIIIFFLILIGTQILYWTFIVSSPNVLFRESQFTFWDAPLRLSAAIMYIFFMLFYLVNYINASIESPTQTLLLLLKQYDRLTYADLLREMSDDRIIIPRLEALVENHIAVREGNRVRLLYRGVCIGIFFSYYQRLFRKDVGG